jgi:hypothetical protein
MGKKKEGEKPSESGESSKGEKAESSVEEEPDFSDPEGYEDDISDEGKSRNQVDKNAIVTRVLRGKPARDDLARLFYLN